MIFYSKKDIAMHRITYHKFIFKCESCDRTFKAKRTLRRHVRLNHTNQQNIKTTSLTSNPFAMALRSEEKAGKSFSVVAENIYVCTLK